jgi:GNAT superfamily N-acetyltransferase
MRFAGNAKSARVAWRHARAGVARGVRADEDAAMTVTLHHAWAPGAIGDIAALHGRHYAASHGFGSGFETMVATGLGEFLQRLDPARDMVRLAERDGRFLGCFVLDGVGAPAEARLRYIILDDALRGQGLAAAWMTQALAHARAAGWRRVMLWTLEGLDPARRLYERAGFTLEETRDGAALFGSPCTALRYGIDLMPAAARPRA